MTSQKTEEILEYVLDKSAELISDVIGANYEVIREILERVPNDIKCQHIFTKGKRKGDKCEVILCPHHNIVIRKRK